MIEITKYIRKGGKSSRKRREDLLSLALSQSISFIEIQEIGGLSEKRFIDQFVKTNIFRPNKWDRTYTLQFDVTRVAVKKALGL